MISDVPVTFWEDSLSHRSRKLPGDEVRRIRLQIIRIQANSAPSLRSAERSEASGNNHAFRLELEFRLLITPIICKTVSGRISSGPKPTELSCRWIDRVNSLRVNNLVRNPVLRNVAGLFRQMLVLPLLIVVVSAVTAPAASAQDPATHDPDVVRSVREIHLLPEERLKDRVAVDLECVVAYYAPDWPIAFLHDGTTGIYAGGPKDLNVKTGDRIRVRGVVGPPLSPETPVIVTLSSEPHRLIN